MEDNLVSKNLKYLEKIFTTSEVSNMSKHFKTKDYKSSTDEIHDFTAYYTKLIKQKHQKEYKESDKELNKFLNKKVNEPYEL